LVLSGLLQFLASGDAFLQDYRVGQRLEDAFARGVDFVGAF
jgi:hypothetical protein